MKKTILILIPLIFLSFLAKAQESCMRLSMIMEPREQTNYEIEIDRLRDKLEMDYGEVINSVIEDYELRELYFQIAHAVDKKFKDSTLLRRREILKESLVSCE